MFHDQHVSDTSTMDRFSICLLDLCYVRDMRTIQERLPCVFPACHMTRSSLCHIQTIQERLPYCCDQRRTFRCLLLESNNSLLVEREFQHEPSHSQIKWLGVLHIVIQLHNYVIAFYRQTYTSVTKFMMPRTLPLWHTVLLYTLFWIL